MSINKLLEFIDKDNIAEDLEKKELNVIAQDVIDRADEDRESMNDWSDVVEKGMDLLKPEFSAKSVPWEGAANFKSPILRESGIAFGDRASLEIMRPKNLFKTEVIGADNEGTKLAASKRVDVMMNYQLNHNMMNWRKHHKKMLYNIPIVGAVFKKTIFNPTTGKNESHQINYPNFLINQATKDIDTFRSFTHILDISKNDMFTRVASKVWLKVDIYNDVQKGDEGSNEKAEVDEAADNDQAFYEQYCYADLDDDGYDEPYIITVHVKTRKVMRIVARYNEETIYVRERSGKIKTVADVKRDFAREIEQALTEQVEAAQRGELTDDLPTSDDKLKEAVLVRVDPIKQITDYGFIPAEDGTFLNVGYIHLIGSLTMLINKGSNELLNSAELANAPGFILAKNFRKKMGPMRMRPGQGISTELSPNDLKNGILPVPFKEPSQTLLELVTNTQAQAKEFIATTDTSGQIQANTAPTTALAIIQEAMLPLSAIMSRHIDSMSREFQILFALTGLNADNDDYLEVVDDKEANLQTDFRTVGLDIMPTANAEMASRAQRIQLAESELLQFDRVLQAGGNPIPIIKNYFEAIGSQQVGAIFPEENVMSDEERQQLEALKESTDQANALAQQQVEIQQIQIDLLKMSEERKMFEAKIKQSEAVVKATKTQVDVDKVEADTEKVAADIDNTEADTILKLATAAEVGTNGVLSR